MVTRKGGAEYDELEEFDAVISAIYNSGVNTHRVQYCSRDSQPNPN